VKWISAIDLDRWADTIGSRTSLSELVSSLVRATARGINSFRFPTGDSAQIRGYDGSLIATGGSPYVPEGQSVWEFGTERKYLKKANSDFSARSTAPGGFDPAKSAFVFVTPRTWKRGKPSLEEWQREKTLQGPWKDVKLVDGAQLETWLECCPGVAASFAREVLQVMPGAGVRSTDEFWIEFASRFNPALSEEVLLCDRGKEAAELLFRLMATAGACVVRADSPEEVVAFAVASIRKADPDVRKYLEARTLVVDTEKAARAFAQSRNLTFLALLPGSGLSGTLAAHNPVLVPLGREDSRHDTSSLLVRPTVYAMSEAIQSMGISQDSSVQLARKCGRSVTVLARLIPSASAPRPVWAKDPDLVPALLLGGWNAEVEEDRAIVCVIAGTLTYEEYESRLRKYLKTADSPLECEGSVWHLLAPVDAFVHLAYLIGREHRERLGSAFRKVFTEHDPALDLSSTESPYAVLMGKKLKHSSWLRDGLATTLLLFAAFEEGAGLHVPGGAQPYVNGLVNSLPGLRKDWRVIASLSHQLPLLMEAAPRPLLEALEQMLGGGGEGIRPIFRDTDAIFSSSPHTGLLWALEVIAWDPEYLARVSLILARLARVDPGGKLSNRPIGSLRDIFLPWLPNTNASLAQRLAALDHVIANEPTIGWQLVLGLLPEPHSVGLRTAMPRFGEAGGSEKEIVTNQLVWEAYNEIIGRALALVDDDPERWTEIVRAVATFSPTERERARRLLEEFAARAGADQRIVVWGAVRDLVNTHRAFQDAAWAMKDPELGRFESIAERLQPDDPVARFRWLFDDYHPRLPLLESAKSLEEIEEARADAVRQVCAGGKCGMVIALAQSVKLPRFVGYSAAAVIDDLAGIEALAEAAFQHGAKLDEFAMALSAGTARKRWRDWADLVSLRSKARRWTPDQVAMMLLWWRNEPETWGFAASLGAEVERKYWERKPIWPAGDDVATLEMAARKYLSVGRAVSALDVLHRAAKMIAPEIIFEALDRAVDEFNKSTAQVSTMITYELERIFEALEGRSDVPMIEVARREYAYLPFLAYVKRNLTLHRVMAADPNLFVSILCDVFKPAHLEVSEPDEERRRRARAGYQVLSKMRLVPGVTGSSEMDGAYLRSWVDSVRDLAAQADRAVIADEYVGHILAHAPPDARGAWPHHAVCDLLEALGSESIERGILIERHNMRGVFSKAIYEGGSQERALSERAARWAEVAVRWPRTRSMLLELSRRWSENGRREDERARLDEMRYEQ
jgi:hypothetical protein